MISRMPSHTQLLSQRLQAQREFYLKEFASAGPETLFLGYELGVI